MSPASTNTIVTAPARLHCGLFAIGDKTERLFGSMGIMVREPATELIISTADKFQITTRGTAQSDAGTAIANAAQRWFERYRGDAGTNSATLENLPCRIEATRESPRHAGFGSGTQLAFATAAALFRHFELPLAAPEELAPVLSRGKRSAIGTYGFYSGGLLVDRGRSADEMVAPLDFRIEFPESWPIVIASLKETNGMSGSRESSAFRNLPAASPLAQQQSIELVRNEIVPSVTCGDYERLADAIYQLSFRSGLFFQNVQGGPYNGVGIEKLIARIRESGVKAVGQSSWGPAVFAIAPSVSDAEKLAGDISRWYEDGVSVSITTADNQGMRCSSVLYD